MTDDQVPPTSVGEPSPTMVRAMLDSTISTHLPSIKLSSDELDRLTDSVVRMRNTRRELADLPVTRENADRLRELRRELTTAAVDFELVRDGKVMAVKPSYFTKSQAAPDPLTQLQFNP